MGHSRSSFDRTCMPGSGAAVASVGSAALGLVGRSLKCRTTLIYLGLSEGIAIYGVIVSLLILGRV